MQVNQSMEDYLEMMLMLKEQKGYIRSVDIAQALSVTKPSVSHAVKLLRENGYISMDADNLITLTDAGMEIAARMLERHRKLAGFLARLGVCEETAFADACKLEHVISQESFDAICKLTNNA
ncbi:MAG: metal-dependent transcriptional regulator [Eubacteriales bacterium]|nr:metal-dependent transcriptional regulator [Eubacteriales bacterium]